MAEQEAETWGTRQSRGHGEESVFIWKENNQACRDGRDSWGEDESCLLEEKKYESLYNISHFTQTLYLDYRHYVPIKHKRKLPFQTLQRICILPFRKKTKGRIKIYYHLLKILLKINKTNTNKTQQKSPTLSLSLYIFLSISLSLASAGRLSEEEEAERTHLHINCERQGLSSAAH